VKFIRILSMISILFLIVSGCSVNRAGQKRQGDDTKPNMAMQQKAAKVMETGRDGRFISFDNGTVKDSETGLMWAAKDNGTDITWIGARKYCENYDGGGFTDWRMPTQEELAGIYDPASENRHGYFVTKFIDISACCPWPSDELGSEAGAFSFSYGGKYWLPKSCSFNSRALPVRED
jgi:hypothetical protein